LRMAAKDVPAITNVATIEVQMDRIGFLSPTGDLRPHKPH